jgi:hypothetical protein
MTRVATLIPSHISYEGQIILLDKCITSLLEQTMLSDIFISVSFENEIYKKDFTNNILKKYGKITITKITFKFSKEQKYQMEHLHNISCDIDNRLYDMFMFCDDDDTYHIERVETFVNAFNWCKENNFENFGGVREHFKSDNDPSLETPEYWAYGIVPNAITDFFSFFKGNHYKLLQHKFGDMYFRHYLRKNKKYLNWVGVVEEKYRLYKYNINNSNSICGKIEQGIGNTYDNVLLEILDCRTDRDFYNIKNKISEKEMKDFFKYIYEFCKSLYK